jgi:hypothetical protein
MDIEYNRKGYWVYLLFNGITKSCYVGSTSQSLKKRLAQHYHDSKKELHRDLYKYFDNKVAFENWLMIPLELVTQADELDGRERYWIHFFRNQCVNSRKHTKFAHSKRPNNDELRIINRQEQKKEYRKKIAMVLHTDLWKSWSFNTLVMLLNNLKATGYSARKRRSADALIKGHINRTFNIRLLSSYSCTLPSSYLGAAKSEILKWFSDYISAALGDCPLSRYYAKRITITEKPLATLKDVISNTRATLEQSKEYLHGCVCNKYIDLKQNSEHVYLRATELPDNHSELRHLLTLSNGNPIALDARNYLGRAFAAIKDTCRRLNISTRMTQQEEQQLLHILRRRGPLPYKFLNFKNVMRILDNYQGLTFVEIDKNSKTWLITCPQHYRSITATHFNDTSHYEEVNMSITGAQQQVLSNFQGKRFSFKPYRLPKKWSLGNARLLPKHKDLKKYRPIVSFFKFKTRALGRHFGRCLSVMINNLRKIWKTMELSNLNQFVKEIKHLSELDYWKRLYNSENITFLKFDIKNQFTNLDKKSVRTAVLHAIKEIYSKCRNAHGFAIRRRYSERKGDRLGHGQLRDFRNFTFNDLLAYIDFELRNAIFTVGNKVYRQKQGLPMGGFLSAGLAVIFTMYCENAMPHLWEPVGAKWFRYRDDILAIVPRKLTQQEIEVIHRDLNSLYGPHLEVELEEVSNKFTNFLEYWIIATPEKLQTWHYNKNVDLIFSTASKKVIRYLLPKVEISRTTLKGMITGIVKKVKRASTDISGMTIGLMQVLLEWLPLGFKKGWFINAINRTATRKTIGPLRALINTLARAIC